MHAIIVPKDQFTLGRIVNIKSLYIIFMINFITKIKRKDLEETRTIEHIYGKICLQINDWVKI